MSGPPPPGPDEFREIGAYRLIRPLGRGGQGVVYLGRAPSGEDVAVKVLHAWMADDADARRRFLREVDVARQVAPFCTARVLDMGIHDDRPYIVSEYVPGESLERLVMTSGPRTGGGLERLAVSTMTALAAIHRAGIVHRDFKPANVILGPEGPVVIDFGISRAIDHTVTRTGSVGTPPYMAPEQFTHEPPGPSADVFSWACTMVYAATGHRAFPGDTIPVVVNAILHREPDLSGVPANLRPLLAACLAKDPARRPATADLFRALTGESLAPSAGRATLTAPLPSPAPAPARPVPAAAPPPYDPPPRNTPSHNAPQQDAPTRDAPARPDRLISRREIVAAGVGLAAVAAAVTLPSLLGGEKKDTGTPGSSTLVSPGPTAEAAPARPFGTLLFAPLTEPSNDVRTIAFGQVGTVPVVVTGGDDLAVRVFDLAAGKALGGALTGHTGWVRSVAFTELDGVPIAVSGSDDDTVRVWDLARGAQVGAPLTGHDGDVKAVAAGPLDGVPIAITGGADRSVHLWDIAGARPLRAPLTGHTGTVWSIAYGEVNGTPVAVSTGDDRTVRVWDLAEGRRLGDPLTGHRDSVRAVAFGRLNGVPVAVTGGMDKTVRVWDLALRRPIGKPLTGHEGPVWAVAFDEVDGTPVAVSGGDDRTVRVWDLRRGVQLGAPVTGHTDCVWSVATGRVGGAAVAVSGGRDETVRAWSIAPPFPSPRP
ncbi:WD40 repeat domain-containing serine/threonine protein kinase [Sphaerisporangium corydalis]|uniref:WD40 repeat domain-containing serine/threonine protein kinase n=1 Tax=Sphaerisporangium corydalis TaxID=1441875 RepID=A0ABV9EBU4_9ACTN|nr:serine/threonine-protein kinase [Sphaerisporangium corydalis]